METAPLRVEWIEDRAALAALAPEWERLAELDRLPFARHAWTLAWWDAFGGGRRLRTCLLRRDDGELAAVFPLAASGGRRYALSNVHTPIFRPLAVDEHALREVVRHVVRDAHAGLVVEAVEDGSPFLAALHDACRERNLLTYLEPQFTSPVVELASDFESFRASMKKSHRKDIDRCRRKLEREHEPVSLRAVDEPRDLDAELERGFEVEASGWKGERGTAILTDDEALGFYRSVAHAFAGDGRLRLSEIAAGDKTIAFDYALLDQDRLWILKGGFDERYGPYAPGLVLTLAQIERAHELGLRTVELLGDTSSWKLKFATTRRPHVNVRAYRRTPDALGRYGYRRYARPTLRRAYRRLRRGPGH